MSSRKAQEPAPRLRLEAMTATETARLFHETYERLAPSFGYKTREASAVPWDSVPDKNRQLMVAVAAVVLDVLKEPA